MSPLGQRSLSGPNVAADNLLLLSNGNIYTIKLDGSDKVYLTSDGSGYDDRGAAWSFDSSEIVYVRREPDGFTHIWKMNADGSDKKELTSGNLQGNTPSFSPDGKSILFTFSGDAGRSELWLMNSDGTDPNPLAASTGSVTTRSGDTLTFSGAGAFSPDGKKIAYSASESGNAEIWIMNADGSDQRQLTFPDDPNSPDANAPAWSPDGTKIIFWSGFLRDAGNIYTIYIDGSDRTRLTNLDTASGLNADDPYWTADGKHILFDTNQTGSATTYIMNSDGSDQRELLAVPLSNNRRPLSGNAVGTTTPADQILESDGNIYSIASDGTGKTYLTSDSGGYMDALASWSYDRAKIVYMRWNENGSSYIWSMNADGSNKKQLTSGSLTATAATFSPDGQSILFTTSVGLNSGYLGGELWLMNADGTDPHPLTDTTVGTLSPNNTKLKWSIFGSYSPDGTKIAYSSTQGGEAEIWVMNSDGTDKKPLTSAGNDTTPFGGNSPSWSPDGDRIAFAGGWIGPGVHPDIFTINSDGSDLRQLTSGGESDNPIWSPDGNYIYYLTSDGITWVMDVDGANKHALFPGVWYSSIQPIRSTKDDYRNTYNDTGEPLGSVTVSGTATGTIGYVGDKDVFAVTLAPGTHYTFNLDGYDVSSSYSLRDPYLQLLSSSGKVLATSDDISASNWSSEIDYTTIGGGTYYLVAASAPSDGTYTTGSYQIRSSVTLSRSKAIATTANQSTPTDNTVVPVASGDQTLTAGPKPEVFDFNSLSFGKDTIVGFDPMQDALRLSSSLAGDFAAVSADMSATAAGGTVIALDRSHSITLDGVAPANLSASNFRFV